MSLTSMLTTSGSTESTTRPGKGRVGVGGDGSDDGGHIDGNGGRSSNFDRKVCFPRVQHDSRTSHLDVQDELINGLIN